jgi:cytochrome P450
MRRMFSQGVAPAFNTGNIRRYHHHVVYIMDYLIEAIKKGGPDATVDMADVAQR